MNNKELIEKAVIKVGSIGKLADVLGWDKGNIDKAKKGKPLSPYRAAQLGELLGLNQDMLIFKAHEAQAKTDNERRFWKGKIAQRFKSIGVALTVCVSLAVAGFPEDSYAGSGCFKESNSLYNVYNKLCRIVFNILTLHECRSCSQCYSSLEITSRKMNRGEPE